MGLKPDQTTAAARLILCGGLAAVLWGAAAKFPGLEPYRPWLEEHKLEAGAATAAALFGLSLLLFPLPEGERAQKEQDTCCGYSPVA